MAWWGLLLLVPAQEVQAKDFPRAAQMKAVAASVVVVNRDARIDGTGVIIGAKDEALYILTAAHLLEDSKRFQVSVFTEESYPHPAKTYDQVEILARTSNIRDLALLRIKTAEKPPALMPLCPLRAAPSGKKFKVLSVGCGAAKVPLCLLETVLDAKNITRRGESGKVCFWQTAAEQAPGRSGGPLVDTKGRLIGLASGASGGKGYYTHLREIHNWLKAGKFAFLVEDKDK
jgi:S1-C subfamily serine protease